MNDQTMHLANQPDTQSMDIQSKGGLLEGKTVFQQRRKQLNLGKYDIASQLEKEEKEKSKTPVSEMNVKKRRKGPNGIRKKTLTLDSAQKSSSQKSTRRRKQSNKDPVQKKVDVTELDKLPEAGSFQTDSPQKVTAAKLCNDYIVVSIEWKRRANGVQPKSSSFTNKVVREQCPKLLVDFYESRINSKSKAAQTSSTARA